MRTLFNFYIAWKIGGAVGQLIVKILAYVIGFTLIAISRSIRGINWIVRTGSRRLAAR